jgi:hypothetical protein
MCVLHIAAAAAANTVRTLYCPTPTTLHTRSTTCLKKPSYHWSATPRSRTPNSCCKTLSTRNMQCTTLQHAAWPHNTSQHHPSQQPQVNHEGRLVSLTSHLAPKQATPAPSKQHSSSSPDASQLLPDAAYWVTPISLRPAPQSLLLGCTAVPQ